MKIFNNHIERETFYKMAQLFMVFIFFILFINMMPNFLTPILLSIICAYILIPIVDLLERYKIPRGLGTLVLFLFIAFIMFYLLQHSYFKIINQFEGFQNDLPRIVDNQLGNLQNYENEYSNKYPFLKQFDVVAKTKIFVNNFSTNAITNTPKLLSSLFSFFIFIPFFSFFFIKDARRIKKWVLNILPNKYFESGLQIIYDINKSMSKYIQGRLWEAAIVAILTYLGLLFLDVKYSLLLGVIAGILNLVPYIGPLVASLIGLLFAYYYSNSLWLVFFTALVYGFAQLFDTIIVIPIIFSKVANIHPAIVILLIIVGGHVMGILGMIFAVPAYSVLKAIADTIFARIATK